VLTKTMEAFKQTRLPISRRRILPPLTNTIPQWFDGLERTSTTLLGQLRVDLERLAFFPFVFELLVQVWVVSDALEVSCLTSRGTQVFSAATRIFLELACRSLLYVLPAAGLSIHGGPAWKSVTSNERLTRDAHRMICLRFDSDVYIPPLGTIWFNAHFVFIKIYGALTQIA
jgi:hypothetical protein